MKRILWLLPLVALLAPAQQIQHGVICTWLWSGTGTPTYSVYRATVSGGEAKPALVTGLTTTNYTDTSAVVGTKYYYTFTATEGGVESAPSPEVSAQIVPPNAPTSPGTAVY